MFDTNRYRSCNLTAILPLLTWAAFLWCVPAIAGQNAETAPDRFQKCWAYPTGSSGAASVFADSDRVLLKLPGGVIRSLSLTDGREEWNADMGGDIISNIVASDDRYFAVSAPVVLNGTRTVTAFLRSVSKQTGLTGISIKIPYADKITLLVSDGKVIAAGAGGSLAAYSFDGKPIWNFKVAGGLSAGPGPAGTSFIVGTGERVIYRIAAATGETLSRYSAEIVPIAIGRDTDGVLFIGDGRGRLVRIGGGADEPSWTFKSGGRVENISFSEGRVIVASVDNFLYAIDRDTGNVEWKKRLSGRLMGDPVAADQMFVTAVHGETGATVIDSDSGKIVEMLVFEESATSRAAPVGSPNGYVVFTLNENITAYHPSKCAPQKTIAAP